MLIIADNSDQEDLDKIVMGDDLSGTKKNKNIEGYKIIIE